MILGLSGYARSGKDTAAAELAAHGWQRVAYADKMKQFLLALDPVLSERSRVSQRVAALGWDGAKSHPEVRRLLQRLGTDAGRSVLGENVWVDAALNALDPDKNYVVTDARFPNEADAIRSRGGVVLRIERPGVHPVNAHVSETALDEYGFDGIVVNDSTPSALAARVLGQLAGTLVA